jgi:hypothetical protein
VRAAINVIGGIVATLSLMKVYEPPHSVASSSRSASSTAMLGFRESAFSTSVIPLSIPIETKHYMVKML